MSTSKASLEKALDISISNRDECDGTRRDLIQQYARDPNSKEIQDQLSKIESSQALYVAQIERLKDAIAAHTDALNVENVAAKRQSLIAMGDELLAEYKALADRARSIFAALNGFTGNGDDIDMARSKIELQLGKMSAIAAANMRFPLERRGEMVSWISRHARLLELSLPSEIDIPSMKEIEATLKDSEARVKRWVEVIVREYERAVMAKAEGSEVTRAEIHPEQKKAKRA
jgi:hypothetical protein